VVRREIYRQLGSDAIASAAYTVWVRITPEIDDAPDFVKQVEYLANGVVRRHLPETLVLIKIDSGKPIHQRIRGGTAFNRIAATESPNSALVWYSGDSKATGRGAVMAYVPAGDSYWLWYAALETGQPWSD